MKAVVDYAANDTIVAVSSAPGWGSRGILRLSGADAVAIASFLFAGDQDGDPSTAAGFTRIPGVVRPSQGMTLPGECYVFRAPHSFSRQDCAELHTIGSPPLLAMLMDRAVAHGARVAEPGEFTARAFLAGAMDLTQAEAVASLISARSDAQLRASHRIKEGTLSAQLASVADSLAELTSRVEADIDFSEEPIDFVGPDEIQEQLGELANRLQLLLEHAASTERLGRLPTVLLLGAPNAGKSSLMNALTGADRAICSAGPGTTRDILSAPMALPHGEAMLLDAAGHDEGGEAVTRAAQQRLRAAAGQADLICLVIDVTRPPGENTFMPLSVAGRANVVIAANKVDGLDDQTACRRIEVLADARRGPVVPTSATQSIGLHDLRDAIRDALSGAQAASGDTTMALTSRQRSSLQECCTALERARDLTCGAAATIDLADLLAVDLRDALDALGEVTGRVTTEDLLGRVFASFCIGK